jgi:hypothetical protein
MLLHLNAQHQHYSCSLNWALYVREVEEFAWTNQGRWQHSRLIFPVDHATNDVIRGSQRIIYGSPEDEIVKIRLTR